MDTNRVSMTINKPQKELKNILEEVGHQMRYDVR